jgi:hypothetical protein
VVGGDRARNLDRRIGRAPAQDRYRLVVRDPEQPRLERDLAVLPGERAKRAHHRVLERVLGVLPVAEDRAAIAVQGLVVTVVDRGERRRIAVRGKASQPIVRQQAEGPARYPFGGMLER